MSTYRVVGLVVVAAAMGFAAGTQFGTSRQVAAATGSAATAGCDTCVPVGKPTAGAPAAPVIPASSDRPSLVELGSDECEQCKKMQKVLSELEPMLADTADVVRVDTDVHTDVVSRFRLRLIPTQIIVDGKGQELWRHEGFIPLDELKAEVGKAVAASAAPQGEAK